MSKLRPYDNKILADHFALVLQIRAKLEVAVRDAEVDSVSALPDSLLDSDTLYNLCICYEVMYNTLVDQSLLKNGHHKPTSIIH